MKRFIASFVFDSRHSLDRRVSRGRRVSCRPTPRRPHGAPRAVPAPTYSPRALPVVTSSSPEHGGCPHRYRNLQGHIGGSAMSVEVDVAMTVCGGAHDHGGGGLRPLAFSKQSECTESFDTHQVHICDLL
jgi:hypothetical protein